MTKCKSIKDVRPHGVKIRWSWIHNAGNFDMSQLSPSESGSSAPINTISGARLLHVVGARLLHSGAIRKIFVLYLSFSCIIERKSTVSNNISLWRNSSIVLISRKEINMYFEISRKITKIQNGEWTELVYCINTTIYWILL